MIRRMAAADHPITRRLKAARELAGLTAIELADKLPDGYGRATISKMERGVQAVEGVDLERWARACGVPVDFFFVDFAELSLPEPIPAGDVVDYLDALDARIKRLRDDEKR